MLAYDRMYAGYWQSKPMGKEAVIEGTRNRRDEEEDFDWLWMEMGMNSEQELFQLVMEFVQDNYDWIVAKQ